MESTPERKMMNGGEKEVVGVANKNSIRCTDFVLRFLAFALTLVAAIVVGVNKQTKVVPIQVVSTLPPMYVPVTAKWHDMSAFVYFVSVNAIACGYAAISSVLTLANGGGKSGSLSLMIILSDLVMVGLLFSSGGAASAVGLIGYNGNSHVRWNKVCDVFDKFCRQMSAALVVSLVGSALFLLLVFLAVLNLHKKRHH